MDINSNKSSINKHPIVVLLVSIQIILFSTSIQALPSFSRQTGEACIACHVQSGVANLTPRGRDFKLKGYIDSNAKTDLLIPLSLVINGGGVLDETDYKDYPFYSGNNSRNYFSGSLFYAGKVANHLGAYVEGTYTVNPETGFDKGYLNKVDIRVANQVVLPGHVIDYGISINNEPGVQDLWNTNAAWQSISLIANSSYSPAPLANGGLRGQLAGATLYASVNNLLYLEAGAYASLPNDIQNGIGRYNTSLGGYNQINGSAPYWRIALQHDWNGHYLSVGHFGLQADTEINRYSAYQSASSYVSYSDLGIDATYQYLANPNHIVELTGRYVHETINGKAYSLRYYQPSNKNTSESFTVKGAYTWQQTVSLAVGYQQYSLPNYYYYSTQSDFQFLTTELSFTPFGKQHSLASPWLNLRLDLGYITDVSGQKSYYSGPRAEQIYLNGQLSF